MGLSGVPSLYKAGGLQVDLEGACHGKKAQSGLGGEAVNACQGLGFPTPDLRTATGPWSTGPHSRRRAAGQ